MQTERLLRRRSRKTGFLLHLMFPIVAGLCLAHISSPHFALAFVLAPSIASGPGLSSRRHNWATRPPPPLSSTARHRSEARMVLSESPTAACRRALRRAWKASSPEAILHEQVRVHVVCATCLLLCVRTTMAHLLHYPIVGWYTHAL